MKEEVTDQILLQAEEIDHSIAPGLTDLWGVGARIADRKIVLRSSILQS